MFASGTRTRTAFVATGAVLVALVSAAPSVRALEGIQGRHAIFYPSLELVYQHDDNYFLTPDNEISANTFIAHGHLALEVPGARQYLRVEYEPQFRNVDVNDSDFDIEDDVQHFFELDATLRGSSIFSVEIDDDFTLGNIEFFDLDAERELVKGSDEQWWTNNLDIDFKWEGSRQGAILSVGHTTSQFDDLDNAPPWFELDEIRFGGEYFYKFTPLTSFLVGVEFGSADQDYTPAVGLDANLRSLESDTARVYFGFDGELGRTTTGRAHVGFVSRDYDGTVGVDDETDFDGLYLRADVTKSFSRWAKLIFGARRDVNYSAYVVNPLAPNTYYVSNSAAVTFAHQPQGARVGWSLKGGFQRNTYDVPTEDPVFGGPEVEREDDISHFRAEVGYHALEHLSFRLNYRWEKRDSNQPSFDYTDNLIIFQVQVGF